MSLSVADVSAYVAEQVTYAFGLDDEDQLEGLTNGIIDLVEAARQEKYPVAAIYYDIGAWNILFPVPFVDAMEREWGSGWWRRYRFEESGGLNHDRYHWDVNHWLNTGEIPRKEQ